MEACVTKKETEVVHDSKIDLLKAIAIVGVIVIHTCSYQYEIASANWIASVFWGSVVRASVPIFFMCSGALLLAPEKTFSTHTFFRKNVLRILVSMFFWAMAYKLYHLAAGHAVSAANVGTAVKEVILLQQEFHLYYLQIILIVYLFLPVTRLITASAKKRELIYFLALWFVFGIVFPTVLPFWPFSLLSGIPLQYKINMTYAAIGYGVLGYYLKRFPVQHRSWYMVSAASGFCITFGGTVWFSVQHGSLNTQWLEGMSVGVCFLAAGIFGLAYSAIPLQNQKAESVLRYVSNASFCIYLSHVFFLYVFAHFGITANLLPTVVGTPIVSCLVFGCGILTYAILSHIPIVNKWLI